MEENQVIDAATPEVVVPEVSEPVAQSFTADDLAKARAQEKAKLYPQMEKMAAELESLKKAQAEEAARKAEKAKLREQEKEAKQKQKDEDELSAKELLAKKEQEWQSQLEAERLERENAFALLEKERKFQDLMNYRSMRIEQERDSIVPQLIDLVNGASEEEIEQSIETLKAKSAGIMQDVQQTVLSARQQMPGARVTAPASGPLDNDSEHTISTPDSIRDMSMADYAKQRAKLLGNAASNRGQGLFG
jgi:DNA repair exonuclease SbcCD ATPase subunit